MVVIKAVFCNCAGSKECDAKQKNVQEPIGFEVATSLFIHFDFI